ncbi:MAG: class I SAM-dependent methyltransferase [Bacteroidota bacterium]|nr:class I SAM-dependent methyltransferase [Bacteroidota bacterium]
MNLIGPKSIKHFLPHFFNKNREQFNNKIVLDIPAGEGVSSKLLQDIGAQVIPFDLFPEFFKVDGLSCRYADLNKAIPVDDAYADFILCQEGIEHLPNQLSAFQEMNRVLKKQGRLILTTPNYSSLRSRLSYFFTESEYLHKIMPPNEIDSVWFAPNDEENVYYGHIFLLGIQKMRAIAKLAGFRIHKVHSIRANGVSVLLFIVFYPFIYLSSIFSYFKACKKAKRNGLVNYKETYKEATRLLRNPAVLTEGYLFVEFEKDMELGDVRKSLKSVLG